MIIEWRNVRCAAKGSEEELTWLRDILTIKTVHRGQDRFTDLFRQTDATFPSGWLRSVARIAKADSITLRILDYRGRPAEPDPNVDIGWLEPHQREAVKRLLAAGCGILDAVTSSGKTEVAIAIVKMIPIRWAFLVRDKSLLTQTLVRYRERTGDTAGKIGGGCWSVGSRLTVISTPTMYRHYSPSVYDHDGKLVEPAHWTPQAQLVLDGTQGVICDECHGAASEQDTQVLTAMRNAYYRLGLSGSPVGRSDKRDAHVISHFGQIVHTISYREMAEIGRVATGRVQLIDCPQTLGGSYSSGGYQANIVTSKVRNGKVLQLWATCPKPCITFVKEIAHGERLMKAAARMNLTAAFVHGDVPDSERRRILANVDAGNIQVLIASPAIKQAVDIVHLRCGINACGGREVIGSIQRIGRPGRVCRAGQNGKCLICTTAGQKTEFVWYDFKDYDPIAAKRDDWLRRHASIRAEALRGKGYTVEEP